MRFAERAGVVVAAWVLAALTGCGGGTSSETTVIGGGIAGGTGAASASVDVPTGPNTTEIVVDSGPASGFSLGAANIPYVTITVCTPGSTTDCTTIDHVFLDTGSIGLRVLKSAVAKLTLPAVAVPFNAVAGTVAGNAAECYPFVLGAVWGTIASADLRIAGELAASIPIQLIDDASPATIQVPADCIAAADGGLQNSVSSLQANGILGVGMLAYDCGLACINGDYSSGHTLYYSCPPQAASPCTPAAVPGSRQVQNPVVHFAVNNNGTLIALPPLPDLGAQTAKGRLVFGIGTQANNQIAPSVKMYFVDADPASANYLYLSTSVGAATYAQSYVDSGSNAYFFDDPSMPHGCQSTTGTIAGWYCPTALQHRTATIRDARGATGQVDFAVANADALFSTSSLAFADLAGSVGAGGHSFTWGLPFFFGRTVYTSIWGQALSTTGPWNAF